MVQAVNAAGNYWKHSAEWKTEPDGTWSDGAMGKRNRDTIAAILGATPGPHPQEYALGNVLCALLHPLPARFERLLPFLTAWRDEVLRKRA